MTTTPIDETEPQKKTYQPTSMGEILEFAESLGWSEPEGYPHHDRGWEPDDADGLEQAALDHIEDAGYEIMEPNE